MTDLVVWAILLAFLVGFVLLVVFGWPAIGRTWFGLDTSGKDRGRWWGLYWICFVTATVLSYLGNLDLATDGPILLAAMVAILFLAAWHPLGVWTNAARGQRGKWWLFLVAMSIPLLNWGCLLWAIIDDRREKR